MDELKLPEAVRQMARANNGLILVTGKTGSGKSTTLAAMIDDINRRVKGHILTIEDPIEFVHERKSCLISQREIGVHAPSFSAALHSALREDPDVILVGELRDLETMSIAVTAAEMGILVMGTLHTNGAAQTVDRMVNVFPSDKQSHVRTMLSTSLRGVVSQQLLQRADKSGRVAALEILVNTPAASNLIRQGKLDQLENTMQAGGAVRHAHHGHRHPAAARFAPDLRQGGLQEGHQQGQVRGRQGLGLKSRRCARAGGTAGLCKLARCPARSSSPPRCPMPTARFTSATSWSTSRRTSGCASSACRGTSCSSSAPTMRTAHPSCSRREAEGITPQQLVARIAAERPRYLRGLPHQLRSLVVDRVAREHRAVAGHLPAPAGGGPHLSQVRASSSTTR